MDIVLIAAGAGLAFWGTQVGEPDGGRSSTGNLLLVAGALALVIGVIVFSVAFANGFSQGLQESR